MADPQRILVVDDMADNREVLRARLANEGYAVEEAADGYAALDRVERAPPDLVLLDVMMPGIDGIETVRRLKSNTELPFVPVVLLTARSDAADIVAGLDAGADEYLVKPIDHTALLSRVRAMLRIKALQDAVSAQAAQLRTWNARLNERVAAQVAEIKRMQRLRRFLAPQVADAILAEPDGEAVLESHRREVAVLFCDLRGFTAFSETAAPEEVMELLRDYHAIVGEHVFAHQGTLERFGGDSITVLFNDPLPSPLYCQSAVALAQDVLRSTEPLITSWRQRGAALGLGIGLAAGFATLGRIGFRDRLDYAATGPVTNLAARLSTMAEGGQILANRRIVEAMDGAGPSRFLGDQAVRGFSRAVPIYEIALK